MVCISLAFGRFTFGFFIQVFPASPGGRETKIAGNRGVMAREDLIRSRIKLEENRASKYQHQNKRSLIE